MSSGRHAFQTCICSLIGFNSYFVLYLMCCFGNNPLYMDFKPIKILFCSVLFCTACTFFVQGVSMLTLQTFQNAKKRDLCFCLNYQICMKKRTFINKI